MFYSRSFDILIKKILGKKFVHNNFAKSYIVYFWGKYGHGIKEWKSSSDYLNSYYIKSRDLISSITKGQVTPKGPIVNINKNNIIFQNGEKQYDIILFCTGYKASKCVSFLPKKLRYDKYKHIFSPHDPTLYFCGFIRPYLTSIPMISELQSRWIAKVITKKTKLLPNKEIMLKIIKSDRIKQKKEFPSSYQRLSTIIDPYDYCNEIATIINLHPNIIKLYFHNPKLANIVLFDSWNHLVFRLNDKKKENREIAEKYLAIYSNNLTSIKIRSFMKNTLLKALIFLNLILLICVLIYRYFK